MRYGSVKHIALYYKAIPGMLRLLRQERTERPRIRSQPHRGRRKCDIYYGHRLR